MHLLGEAARLGEVGLRGLAPDHVGVGRVGLAALDGGLDAALVAEEAFLGALAGDERAVGFVDVGGEQERAVGVGARDHQRGDVEHVGREPRRDQLLDRLLRRHQHLAAHVAALLGGGELILEVDARGARLDHLLHQLVGVEHAAETCFGVGDDRREPVRTLVVARVGVLDLVGARSARC